MKLFVGLGNPGSEYARQRHNVGFMAVERIAERHGLGPWKKRFHGLVCEGPIGGHRVMLLKPQTFMNDSGRSVGEAQRYVKVSRGRHLRVPRRARPGARPSSGSRPAAATPATTACARSRRTSATSMRACASASAIRAPRSRCCATCCTTSPRPMRSGSIRCSMPSPTRRRGSPPATTRASSPTSRAQPRPASRRPRLPPPRLLPCARRSAVPAPRSHPAGERQGKRASALAENLKRWLKGRSEKS